MRDGCDLREAIWGRVDSRQRPFERDDQNVRGDFELLDLIGGEHRTPQPDRRSAEPERAGRRRRHANWPRTEDFAGGPNHSRRQLSPIRERALARQTDRRRQRRAGDVAYTGIRFAEGTSVGIGQMIEWYVNYGRGGMIVVFMLIGALLTSGAATVSQRKRATQGHGDGRRLSPGIFPAASACCSSAARSRRSHFGCRDRPPRRGDDSLTQDWRPPARCRSALSSAPPTNAAAPHATRAPETHSQFKRARSCLAAITLDSLRVAASPRSRG